DLRLAQDKRTDKQDLNDIPGGGSSFQRNAADHIAASRLGNRLAVSIRTHKRTPRDGSTSNHLAGAANSHRHGQALVRTIEVRQNPDGHIALTINQSHVVVSRSKLHKVIASVGKVLSSSKGLVDRNAHLAHTAHPFVCIWK